MLDDEAFNKSLEYVNNSLDYAKDFFNFLVSDRNKLVDMIILLFIDSGKYDIEIPLDELIQVKKNASIYYKVTGDDPESYILKFGVAFTDERREEIKEQFRKED